jgi:hypothetical protein
MFSSLRYECRKGESLWNFKAAADAARFAIGLAASHSM